jgi:hypothetical protein
VADAPKPEPKPDIRDIWKIHEAAQHLPRFPRLEKKLKGLKKLKPRQLLMIGAQVLVVIAALIVLISWLHPDHTAQQQQLPANTTKGKSIKAGTTATPQQPLVVNESSTEEPNFTVYYPGPLPDPLKVDKSSIKYNPDSFSFRVGKTEDVVNFFVAEQTASEKFNLVSLRSTLKPPLEDFSIFIGQAVTGNYKDGTVTGILTKDKTLILINCSGYNCAAQSKMLANTLQINTDKSIFKK